MFCENCGKQIEDGAKFCEYCGSQQETPLQEVTASETERLDVPVQEAIQASAAEAETTQEIVEEIVEEPIPATSNEAAGFAVNDFATPNFEEEYEKPKKSFKLPKGVIIAAASVAVVAIAAIVAVMCFDLKGAWIKTFGSNEEYYAYVETKNITEGTGALVKSYGKLFDAFSGDGQSVEGSLSFEISDEALDILEPYMGSAGEVDVEDFVKILNNLKLNVASNQKDGLAQAQLGVELSGNELINVDAIVDYLEGEYYVGAPDLADGYLAAGAPVKKELLKSYEILYSSELWDAMPSDSDLDAFLNRYITAALESIEDVSVEDGEIEVGDITEDCTVIEYDISEKTMCDMALAVLEAAREDSDLEDIINNFNEYADSELNLDADMYDELMDAVDEMIDKLEDESKDASDKAQYTIITYVNSDHEIIGRELIAKNGSKEKEVASIKTADDGEFATEVKINGQVVLEGEGTKSGDTIEQGEYAIVVDNREYLNIELEDFSVSVSDYEISGTIKLSPGKDLWKEILGSGSAASIVKTIDPALAITLDCTEDTTDMTISLLAGDEALVSIIFEGETSSGSSVDIPDDTIDVEDDDEGQEWLESIDFAEIKDNVIDSLEDADVSEDMIDIVTEALEMAEDEFN